MNFLFYIDVSGKYAAWVIMMVSYTWVLQTKAANSLWTLLVRWRGGEKYWPIYRLGVCNCVALKTEAAFSLKHSLSTDKQLRFEKHRMLCEQFIITSSNAVCCKINFKVLHHSVPVSVYPSLLAGTLSDWNCVLHFFDIIAEVGKVKTSLRESNVWKRMKNLDVLFRDEIIKPKKAGC